MIDCKSEICLFSKLLIRKWTFWFFLGIELITFMYDIYSSSPVKIPSIFYFILAYIGLYLASFQIYLDLFEYSPKNIRRNLNLKKEAFSFRIREYKTEWNNNKLLTLDINPSKEILKNLAKSLFSFTQAMNDNIDENTRNEIKSMIEVINDLIEKKISFNREQHTQYWSNGDSIFKNLENFTSGLKIKIQGD